MLLHWCWPTVRCEPPAHDALPVFCVEQPCLTLCVIDLTITAALGQNHYMLSAEETEWRAGEVFGWAAAGALRWKLEATFALEEAAAAQVHDHLPLALHPCLRSCFTPRFRSGQHSCSTALRSAPFHRHHFKIPTRHRQLTLLLLSGLVGQSLLESGRTTGKIMLSIS